VAEALRARGVHEVFQIEIDRPGTDEVEGWPGEVVFPVLHGGFGEGGPLQDMLEASGRAYVGSGPRAARLCMDKLATKLGAAQLGIPTAPACALNPVDDRTALDPPLVIKPSHEGSSVGLHRCRSSDELALAMASVRTDTRVHPGRGYMAEAMIDGRELTVAVLDGRALPIIEIVPALGVYDFEAKYERGDTGYVVNPPIDDALAERVSRDSERLCESLGVRHLARVDYMVARDGGAYLLEVNTMPGFTATSLVPKAARAAGIEMPLLCDRLVSMAIRDRGQATNP